jgi:predicted DNA-binding transcriptional regulator AlpA
LKWNSNGTRRLQFEPAQGVPQNIIQESLMAELSENSLLRLAQVLEIFPVSRSAWLAGCKNGRYPQPVKLGPRARAWRASDIAALIESLPQKGENSDTPR